MKAAEVHRLISTNLAAWCRIEGFTRFPRVQSAWYREGQSHQLFRIHLGKLGYCRPIGGEMQLRAWCSHKFVAVCDPFEQTSLSINDAANEPIARSVKAINDSVIRKSLDGDWSLLEQVNPRIRDVRQQLMHRLDRPYTVGMWQSEMSYIDADDVNAWTRLMVEQLLPRVSQRLAEVDL